jgi:hypothetical protein
MRRRPNPTATLLAASLAALLALAAFPLAGHANWLKILREAGEAGGGAAGKAGRLGIESLDNAAAHVAKLPATAKGTALAAHVTQEGHWKFVNREGEVFTAATPAEMARVGEALAPGTASGGSYAFYLSEETVLMRAGELKQLPAGAELHIVAGRDAFRLRPAAGGGANAFVAEVRPGLAIALGDRTGVHEALYHLRRPLNRANIRVLALEPGGPKALSSVPGYDPATKAALIDTVDPAALGSALARLRHQTLMVSGRVDGDALVYKPSSGPEGSIRLSELSRAAEAAEADLVVLAASGARQPGGRNWLWQTVEVAGLDDAMKRATFGDFLAALASGRGELVASARPSSAGRATLSVEPTRTGETTITDKVGTWVSGATAKVMGDVAVEAVQAYVPDRERLEELDRRIVPGIPSWVQYLYLGCLVAGLVGWEFSSAWWSRVWPPERREEYGGAFGYQAARAARLFAFLLFFLPLIGLPAAACALAMQLWRAVTAPFRWLAWLWGKTAAKA